MSNDHPHHHQDQDLNVSVGRGTSVRPALGIWRVSIFKHHVTSGSTLVPPLLTVPATPSARVVENKASKTRPPRQKGIQKNGIHVDSSARHESTHLLVPRQAWVPPLGGAGPAGRDPPAGFRGSPKCKACIGGFIPKLSFNYLLTIS